MTQTAICHAAVERPSPDTDIYTYPVSVAVCTLADDTLNEQLSSHPYLQQNQVMVAPLRTENIGIEQIIEFCVTQPNIRTIVVCGEDSKQAIGYQPGQSLVALMENGVDSQKRIIGANGRRPFLHNLTHDAIDYFRQKVTVIDLIDDQDAAKAVMAVERTLNQPNPPVEPFPSHQSVTVSYPHYDGIDTKSVNMDSAGYVVIEPLWDKHQIKLTHYQKQGGISGVITAPTGKAVILRAIELGWVSQLDHAAYLGKELQKAERAIRTQTEYIQDMEHEGEAIPPAPCPIG